MVKELEAIKNEVTTLLSYKCKQKLRGAYLPAHPLALGIGKQSPVEKNSRRFATEIIPAGGVVGRVFRLSANALNY